MNKTWRKFLQLPYANEAKSCPILHGLLPHRVDILGGTGRMVHAGHFCSDQ